MYYAEHNRQILSRYPIEQCILRKMPPRVLKVLQRGDAVTARHLIHRVYLLVYLLLTMTLLPSLIINVLAFPSEFSSEARIPIEVTVGGVDISLGYVSAANLLLLVILIGFGINFGIFLRFIVVPILSTAPTAKRLNRLWEEGQLLISQSVVIGKPRDSDYRYGVTYEFVAPDRQRISEQFDTDRISERAKAEPVMLMLYKNADDYMVL